jgi:hypothetical protein
VHPPAYFGPYLSPAALRGVVDALPDDQHVGLRVFGQNSGGTPLEEGCDDTELIHPVGPLDREGLISSINSFDASGYTPIARSLSEGAGDLPPEGDRTMVLVSDGMETCPDEFGQDPCAVAEELRAGGIELIIHTVGFALDMAGAGEAEQAREELGCVAEAADGTFVEAEEAGDLAEAIEQVRDRREAVLAGGELEGAPLPRDAATGQLDTPYTDTVRADEVNFYRFEVDPGQWVRAEAILTPAGNHDCYVGRVGADFNNRWNVSVRDAGDNLVASTEGLNEQPRVGENAILHSDEAQMDRDEIWIRVAFPQCNHADIEFDLEIQLATVD